MEKQKKMIDRQALSIAYQHIHTAYNKNKEKI